MGLFDFINDAVDLVKDIVKPPEEPIYSTGDRVCIAPKFKNENIYDELNKRNLTAHQKELHWEVIEDDGIFVTMFQVGYKGTRVKVLNEYLAKEQPHSPSNKPNVNQYSSSQSQTVSFTPTGFKIGDLVCFQENAAEYYDARTGAKFSITDPVKTERWEIKQFDIYNNKMVILQAKSDVNVRVKAKVSSLSLAGNGTTVSPSQTALKIGSLVRFKDDATIFYNARNNTQFYIDEYLKKEIWYIDHFDFKNPKMVVLQSKADVNYKIKANTADICPVGDNAGSSNKTTSQPIIDSMMQKYSKVQSTGEKETMINYNGYQFTALGLSGSGKTCFMAGMYYKMSGGVSGYTLKAGDDDSVSLTAYYEQMMNSNGGVDRFPGDTNQSTDYSFELQYGYKTLEKFRWIDYAGGTLKNKNTSDAGEYQQLKNDIAKSEMLYIFVDGGLFQDEEVEYAPNDTAKIDILTDIIMDSCSRQINHFLSEYANERKKLPPIAIVVTKYDLAVKALGKMNNEENMQMLYKIIQRAFNPLFPDPNVYMGDDSYASMVGIIPVSLGMKISEGGYTGRLRPINMHLPAYVGIWFMLKNAQNNQDTPINRLADEIEDSGVKFWLNGQSGKFSTLSEVYLKKIKEVR